MCRFLLFVTLICASVLNGAPSAPAQTYPTHTVRFIIPFGPASASDITARLFADRLTARWGKPVVVENRPGGDGLVAIGAFTGANDDHTLLFGPAGTFVVHPYEYEKLPYDADRDLLPISNVSTIILAFSTPESLKLGSIGDFVALARANPGTLNAAASSGNSDFLLFGFLKSSGLQVAKVPYRDILQAPNDLAEGRIQALMTSLAVVRPQMQAGRVKVLAVTSHGRAPTAPEISHGSRSRLPLAPVGKCYGPVWAARHARRSARTRGGRSRVCARSRHSRSAGSRRADRQSPRTG